MTTTRTTPRPRRFGSLPATRLPRHPVTLCPAFSLIEIVVSMLIVGTMFAASAWAVGVAARDRRAQADSQRGAELCRSLLAEILEQRYKDPNNVSGPNPPAANGAPRSAWDDVSDYSGLLDRPPTFKNGAAVPDASAWQRSVTVTAAAVDASNMHVVNGGASDTGLKKITVTALGPRGKATTLVAYRCSAGAPDIATPAGGSVTWVGASLTVGSEQTPALTGIDLVNLPAP